MLTQSLAQLIQQHPELMKALTPKMTGYIPHAPSPKQAAFLLLDNHLEVFFGGAAGGGKSDALLMAALQYVDMPNYSALILRRTYSDLALPGAIMDRAFQWLRGTDARWVDYEKTFKFPSGATLTFGYLENEKDKYRYQSAEFQFVGFDELTQFQESQYLYLFSRLRKRTDSNIPLRMRSASNPGNVGHHWVYGRFIDPKTRGDRLFIPSRLYDNPHIDRQSYEEGLKKLDPVTRAQMLDGDWNVHEQGGKFKREWFKLVKRGELNVRRCCRYWDLASTSPKPGTDPDFTVGALVSLRDGNWTIHDIKRFRGTPQQVEAVISAVAKLDGVKVPVFIEQEPGSSGTNTIDNYKRKVLIGYSVRGHKSTGSKETRGNPVSAAAESGLITLVTGRWIPDFYDEAEVWPYGLHDDQVDAISGAFEVLAFRAGGVGVMR